MASSSSSPSLPVLSSQSWSYDVFLSFRGEDVRKKFVDHLYTALVGAGILTYKDDETLPRGESIGPALLKAIEESQIAVIIFSKNYANSTWCLGELAHIMKCMKERKQTVMPIFCDVEPTEVRKQKGTYKEAFDKHELRNKEKIESWWKAVVSNPWGWLLAPLQEYGKYREAAAKQELENKESVESWRKALVEASNISGWETNQIANGHEALGIKEIVNEISQSLKPLTSGENKDLIGIKARVQAFKSVLEIKSSGVRMVGIWGVGGIGKTTLASSVYDDISRLFDGCCFLNNIREESSKNGLEKLQKKILSGVLKKEQVQEVGRVEEGGRVIKARLGHKKVLIVLDDVDQLDQLKALVGSHDWFGEGSRIIITTRDEHLLYAPSPRVDGIHQINLLNNDEAVKLFCKHAHGNYTPKKDFEKLTKEVVSYAGGLPLALTVLGAFLCGRNVSHWRNALDRLKEIPHEDIIGKLRISFDGLKQVEKDLFLDIACFFRRKEKEDAMKMFDACGFYPDIGVDVLRQKALIVLNEYGEFEMHDLVQEMGHYIVRGEHPRNPEKHSRVWKREDVKRILAMAATTKLDNIEAIDQRGLSYEESQRFLQVAGNMNKLRWIDLSSDDLYNEDEIIVPLPENFPPPQLCYLSLSILQKQLWEGYKDLPNLRHMELVDMPNLIKIPDFAGLPNLETFQLWGCLCVEEIHPSIGHLERLVFLSIRYCPRLRKFPSITRIKKLETLVFHHCYKLEIMSEIQQEMANVPHNMNRRRLQFSHSTLRKLELSYCSLGDEEIGSAVWDLPNLEELDLRYNTLITRLDFSNLRLPRLKWLDVTWCKGLVELSELPSSIAVVIADKCDSLESFGDISNCKWLWYVSLYGKNKLGQLRVDTLIHSMLQGNAIEKDHFISVNLNHQFPSGLVVRLIRGLVVRFFRRNTFRLQLPDNWYNEFSGFLICILSNSKYLDIEIIMKQEGPPFDLSQESDEPVEPRSRHQKRTCIRYIPFSSLMHTTLTSSYDIISVTIHDMYPYDESDDEGWGTYVGVELISRKSRSDEVQTTDFSEFWDKQIEDKELSRLKIQQCNSGSSIKISWTHYNYS